MAKNFLETSALIELVFWDKATRAKVAAVAPPGAEWITSRYVLYEVCRGFLRNLILLHNKSLQVPGFSDLVEYAAHSRFAPHRMGTIMGAFSEFFRQPTSFPISSPEELLSEFRANMRRKIRRGFAAMHSEPSEILNPVDCRDDLEAPHQDAAGHFQQELKKDRCGDHKNCGLKGYYSAHKSDFERVRETLDPTQDRETHKRHAALRELYRVPKRDFDRDDCYYCGDATITHECPIDATLVSKNEKHISPIVTTLKKTAVFYT